jgi:CheY-like chemotaxis protein
MAECQLVAREDRRGTILRPGRSCDLAGECLMQSLLIVDDRADNRKLLGLSPRHLYPMVEAEDAATAWDLLLQHHPRGVILDVMMPVGRDGFDLCAKIRAGANPEVKPLTCCF